MVYLTIFGFYVIIILRKNGLTWRKILPTPESQSPATSNNKIRIAPSVMCANLCNLSEDIQTLEKCGISLLHFDLMDAHFVPNMPIGITLIEQLRQRTPCDFDIHLMVENNEFFVDKVAEIGVQQVAVHAESAIHLDRTLSLIQGYGIKAGVALNPATPLSTIKYVVHRLDFVLIMTVNPGFAGQKLVPATLQKISDCRSYLGKCGVNVPIEVDGNVSFENIPKMVSAGADILVGGSSSVFHSSGSRAENIQKIQEAISFGLADRGHNGM